MKKIELIEENNLIKLCLDRKDEAESLLKSTRRTYGIFSDILSRIILPSADHIAKKWLTESNNPYHDEIKQYADILGTAGIYALNLSYEWGCTSGVFRTDSAPDILRILDWPFPGLGKTLCIVKQEAEAGVFYNVTWPAVSGVFQAMAPGRFAASINQAPMRQHGLTIAGDWIKNRNMFYNNHNLPPAHLLRHVFETAKDFNEAKSLLMNTPICMPVIYSLSGTKDHEACIIERLEDKAEIREISDNKPSVSVSNHFQTTLEKEAKSWKSRAIDSKARATQVKKLDYKGFRSSNFEWLSYPMVNELTRLCMVANAKNNQLMVQGWEKDGAITEIYIH